MFFNFPFLIQTSPPCYCGIPSQKISPALRFFFSRPFAIARVSNDMYVFFILFICIWLFLFLFFFFRSRAQKAKRKRSLNSFYAYRYAYNIYGAKMYTYNKRPRLPYTAKYSRKYSNIYL